jgi:excisionase family DNA binding protein
MKPDGNDMKRPRLLGLKEAASELGLSVWTLRDLVGAGTLRAVQPPGIRRILIDRKDLERAIEAWKA